MVRARKAVSLLEVILAVVIIGLLAALTIPRLGRAATGPDEGARLRVRVKVLRVAIERYYQDHDAFPGRYPDGNNPTGSEAAFVAQLTTFSDERGRTSDVKDAVYRFGPYLRDGVPPCRVQPDAPSTTVYMICGSTAPALRPDAPQAGWVYNYESGQIVANSNATDSAGRRYSSY